MNRKFAGFMIVMLVLALFMPSVQAQETEFTGDLIITSQDSIIKAKIFVKGEIIYRVEMSKDAGGIVFIRPPKARGKIWMLDPAKKEYTILSRQETNKDPVEAWTNIQYEMGGGSAGSETINGHPCKVFHFKYKGEDKISLKMWLATDLNYVIKREADAKTLKGIFEIVNIETGELQDTVFQIPAEYKEVK